ncbi:MAG TPA: hypothetical protein DIW47_03500 [Bacteroidetes bacterium]|nr:hypothetical protein [Bacteroidota bacterium]
MQLLNINLRLYAQSSLIVFLFILFSCNKEETKIPETCVGKLYISPENYNTDSVTIFAPNIFTPDGYGAKNNERFFFHSTGITQIETKIFENGVLIFESDDMYEGWDGKINGKVDYGLYHYSAIATTIHDEKLELTGFIRSIHGTNPVSNCEDCRFSDQIVPGHGFVHPTMESLKCE